jgi:translation initiation factor 2B subunit (eIF-2B alpha/beta/delta family)
VDDPWATVEHAASDRSSGATEIARTAADALGRLPEHRLLPAIELLLRGHPSMAPLWRLASEMLSHPDGASEARRFAAAREGGRDEVDALAGQLAGRRLITISYSSSIAELVRRARPDTVLCMRSEPGGEGTRAAARMSAWTSATVVEDDHAITHVPGDGVVVGADAVTPDAVVNKVKTRALAEAARARDLPTYAVADESKFIGVQLPVGYPFEAAPLELFTGVAGPYGLLDPRSAGEHARTRPIHPNLRPLLEELLNSGG